MLPRPPKEPAPIASVFVLPTLMGYAVQQINSKMAERGFDDSYAVETLRTAAREEWLYGFGRTWDDPISPRGIVTRAKSSLYSWHGFALAADFASRKHGWRQPGFYAALKDVALMLGLESGACWHHPDAPHVQWEGLPDSPTDEDRALFAASGMEAVWAKYGANG